LPAAETAAGVSAATATEKADGVGKRPLSEENGVSRAEATDLHARAS
jgi:hypothetical protein